MYSCFLVLTTGFCFPAIFVMILVIWFGREFLVCWLGLLIRFCLPVSFDAGSRLFYLYVFSVVAFVFVLVTLFWWCL